MTFNRFGSINYKRAAIEFRVNNKYEMKYIIDFDFRFFFAHYFFL
jgi:hypothetical protein